DEFNRICAEMSVLSSEALAERFRLGPVESETLVPALLAYQALLGETAARALIVPRASLRLGLLLDMERGEGAARVADLAPLVMASAVALGERYRFDAAHAHAVTHLATRLFDDLRPEHGLSDRDRLLLMVAALLHDVGIHVNRTSHHKHTQYLLAASDIFGLSREDLAVVGNVARYHRRGRPRRGPRPHTQPARGAPARGKKPSPLLRLARAHDPQHVAEV